MSNYRDWVALSMLPGIGLISAHKLLEVFSTPSAVLQSDSSHLNSFGIAAHTRRAIAEFKQGFGVIHDYLDTLERWASIPENSVICFDDEAYPQLLKQIADPPLVLYARGDVERLHFPQIAIVGSRSASVSGLQHAERFAKALSLAGLTVTSGLALGVDGAAHRAAVEAQLPTIAVLGCGVDRIYPRSHAELANGILRNRGAIISEYPLGTPPLAQNFPRRNRIISGLSAGVLVIEAATKSGSLITAKQALQQGREVFALPGALNNPQSHGCHGLIREGAVLVENVEHILEQLGALLAGYRPDESHVAEDSISLSDGDAALLELMGFELCSLELLAERSGKSTSELIACLVAMELKGCIESQPEGYRRLV